MTYVVLRRADDGPDPIGPFYEFKVAERYAAWAEEQEDVDHEVASVALPSPLFNANRGKKKRSSHRGHL